MRELRAWRSRLKLSQREASELLGIGCADLSKFERSVVNNDPELCRRYRELLQSAEDGKLSYTRVYTRR